MSGCGFGESSWPVVHMVWYELIRIDLGQRIGLIAAVLTLSARPAMWDVRPGVCPYRVLLLVLALRMLQW